MDRAQKSALVENLNGTFGEMESVVVTHYKGLNVDQMNELRAKMRQNGARLQVAKNRLVKRALAGTTYEPLSEMFTGQTAIAYAPDPVSAAKVVVDFAKENENLVILGGAMGENVLDIKGVENLAKMPSLDELRGTLVGLIQAPATKIARLAKEPAGKLARVFGVYGASGN